jgi:hypothetical protein
MALAAFLVPLIVSQLISTAVSRLPSMMMVRKGEIYGYCAGIFCCAMLLVLTSMLPLKAVNFSVKNKGAHFVRNPSTNAPRTADERQQTRLPGI